MEEVNAAPTALLQANMVAAAWEAILSVKNFRFPTSRRIPSILVTSHLMLQLEMSQISLLDVNAQMFESLRTSWK
jgi:hypothetical protein